MLSGTMTAHTTRPAITSESNHARRKAGSQPRTGSSRCASEAGRAATGTVSVEVIAPILEFRGRRFSDGRQEEWLVAYCRQVVATLPFERSSPPANLATRFFRISAVHGRRPRFWPSANLRRWSAGMDLGRARAEPASDCERRRIEGEIGLGAVRWNCC